jgi:hypothetical protein
MMSVANIWNTKSLSDQREEPEPSDQAAEVVADGGEDGVGGVAPTITERFASHPMLGYSSNH